MTFRLAQAAEVRLGRQRAPQYERGAFMVPYLRSANVIDGRLDLDDVKSMNFDPPEQRIFSLAAGDVLMTEGSGSAETVGTSAVWQDDLPGTVCFQNTLLRLRPRAGVTDGRFLAWWARHAHGSGQIAAVSTGANIQHIGADGLKDLRILLPDIGEQRRIADFLDDRVARIDQIIATRQRQGVLLSELRACALSRWLRALSETCPTRRLGTMSRVASGDFLPATSFVEDGDFPVFGGNGVVGRYDRSNTARASIVVGRVGALCGNVHLLGRDAWVTDNALVVRLRHESLMGVSAAFVAAVLHDANLNSVASRTAQPLITGAQLANQRIPMANRGEQEATVELWSASAAADGHRVLDRSSELMTEYKQSLITAAVTGELDVTTAGSGIPG